MLKYFNTTYPHHLTSNTWTTGCKWHVNIGKFPGRLCSCGNPLPTDCLHNLLVCALPPLATDSSEIFWPLTHHEKSVLSGNKYCLANNDNVKVSKIGSEGWNFCFGDKKCLLFHLAASLPIVRWEHFSVWESEFTRVYFARTAGSLFLPV